MQHQFIAWVDGIYYVSRPVVRLRCSLTPGGRKWLKMAGHPNIYAMSHH